MTLPGARTANRRTIRPYPLMRLVVATALLILVLVAATTTILLLSYQDTLRLEKTNLRNLAIAFAAQTFSVAQAVDSVMLEAERDIAADAARRPSPQTFAHFGENSMAREYLVGIHLYDNGGQLLASGVTPKGKVAPPTPSASDIRAAQAARPDTLRISISNVNPATGRGIINFSRTTVDRARKIVMLNDAFSRFVGRAAPDLSGSGKTMRSIRLAPASASGATGTCCATPARARRSSKSSTVPAHCARSSS